MVLRDFSRAEIHTSVLCCVSRKWLDTVSKENTGIPPHHHLETVMADISTEHVVFFLLKQHQVKERLILMQFEKLQRI